MAGHDQFWDKKFNFRSREVMCLPIKNEEGTLVGCIQAVNRAERDGSGAAFPKEAEKLMAMLASHIAIFIEKCS